MHAEALLRVVLALRCPIFELPADSRGRERRKSSIAKCKAFHFSCASRETQSGEASCSVREPHSLASLRTEASRKQLMGSALPEPKEHGCIFRIRKMPACASIPAYSRGIQLAGYPSWPGRTDNEEVAFIRTFRSRVLQLTETCGKT